MHVRSGLSYVKKPVADRFSQSLLVMRYREFLEVHKGLPQSINSHQILQRQCTCRNDRCSLNSELIQQIGMKIKVMFFPFPAREDLVAYADRFPRPAMKMFPGKFSSFGRHYRFQMVSDPIDMPMDVNSI